MTTRDHDKDVPNLNAVKGDAIGASIRQGKETVEFLRGHQDTLKALNVILADLYWTKYNALVAQGFTEEQALQIVLATGPITSL